MRILRRNIKQFARRKKSKELFIFLGFLTLSYVFWVLQSLSEDMEISMKVPVVVTHVPDKVIITSEPMEYVDIRIRDKGSAIIDYFVDGMPPLDIDFEQYKTRSGVIHIKSEAFLSLIKKRLKNTTTLLNCYPDSLVVYYMHGKGKRVPVVVDNKATIAPQCVLNGTIMQNADSIMVYAPAHILSKIRSVHTLPITTQPLSDTYVTDVSMQPVLGAKFVPNKIKVTIPVEEITTKKLELNCTVYNLPERVSLITFPAKIMVSSNMAVSDFARTNAKDIVVGVDYNQIKKNGGNKLPVKVFQQPPWIIDIETIPDSVEYIIEEKIIL